MITEVPGGFSISDMTALAPLNYTEFTCFPPLVKGGCEAAGFSCAFLEMKPSIASRSHDLQQ